MRPIVRILTTDKPVEAIDQGIVDAVQRGSRVLVKVDVPSPHNFSTSILAATVSERSDKSKNRDDAIANWAEELSQEHGLVWQRVGPDVLFAKLNIPKPIIPKPSTSSTVIQSKEIETGN